MTDEEKLVLSRIELAVGQKSAVGEVELSRLLWPLETYAAMGPDLDERTPLMMTLRRRVRKVVSVLRLDFNEPILDSARGYFFAADDEETRRFCQSRHRRGITSLVIESIVRKTRPLDVGVQQFFEFLKSEEERRRRLAERLGHEFIALDPAEVVGAVAERARSLTAEDAEETARGTADGRR